MRRQKPEAIGSLLAAFLHDNGLETPLQQHRCLEMWPEVLTEVLGPEMGQQAAMATKETYIRNQTLHVHLTSPALRNIINMQRQQFVDRLCQKTDSHVIYSLSLH